MSDLLRRFFGTAGRAGDGPARVAVGASDGSDSGFGRSIQRSQQYADRTDRVIRATEAEIAQLQQQARAYVQAGNRPAAQRCLRLAQQKQAGIAGLQAASRNVGQLTQSAQQTQQSVEAAKLMGELAAEQRAYLEEHGGASGVQALMADVSRTVDEGQLVQETVTDALPDDLFTTAEDNEGIDAMLDAMEADVFQQQVPHTTPLTVYDVAPHTTTPLPPRAPAAAMAAVPQLAGGADAGAGGYGGAGWSPGGAAGPSGSASASGSASPAADLDYYASLLGK